MKTADLTAGAEYLVSSSDDWLSREYGRIERVKVLDTGKWMKSFRYVRDPNYREVRLADTTTVMVPESIRRLTTGRSEGVLAIRLDETGEPMVKDLVPMVDVVPSRNIRGTWEEASAIRQRNLDAARRERDAKRREREETEARKQQALNVFGVKEANRWSGEEFVQIGLDDLEEVVSRLAQLPDMQFPILDKKDDES